MTVELNSLKDETIKGIILRTKAKWKVEGVKSTEYFCNLEKRQYTEKIIPKLIKADGSEIINIEGIIQEQLHFYKDLYSSKIDTNNLNSNTFDDFFDDNNTCLNKLSMEESASLEGSLNKHECLTTLKAMKNNKSPGSDGFTVEFYKFFWNDLCEYLINSLNFGYNLKSMSITQKQGIITCLPKDGKSKLYLKNW